MLLHIRPRLFSPFKTVYLIEFDILGLHLTRKELATRRPYPNKRWAVACRRQGGTKAMDGILIETKDILSEYRYAARWAILPSSLPPSSSSPAEAQYVASHYVHCKILDRDFDAVSEHTMFWHRCSPGLGYEPALEVIRSERCPSNAVDIVGESRMIICRRQTWEMPTIERERLFNSKLDHDHRIPSLAMAFHTG